MKKTKIQNIILYIINFILIGFIILSNKGLILNNNKITLKNMSESTQVNDLNKTIEKLNKSHTEYANQIQTSKQKIANAINMYPNNNATEQNTLEELSIMINNLTNIPENTYYYEEGTEGDASTIKRYKKIGDSYYVCDANGTVAHGTTTIDVSSKKLVAYTPSSTENLSAGSASYSNNSLLLGDGTDNAAYYDRGIANATIKSPSNYFVNGTFGDGANYLKVNLNTFSIQNNAIRVVGNTGQSGVHFLLYLDGTYKTLKYRATCNENAQWQLINCKNSSIIKTWSGTSVDISYDISQLNGVYSFWDGCANNDRNGYIYEIKLL